MRVVLDSNVIISGLTHSGNESRVLFSAYREYFELLASQHIIDEVGRTLFNRFGREPSQIVRDLSPFMTVATILYPPHIVSGVSGSESDDRILDLVIASEADFLVTGDRRHLLPLGRFGNARIITSRDFLTEVEAQQP